MRNMMLILITSLMFLPGCATMLDLGKDVCVTVLGGSKAAALCAEMNDLDEEETPTE